MSSEEWLNSHFNLLKVNVFGVFSNEIVERLQMFAEKQKFLNFRFESAVNQPLAEELWFFRPSWSHNRDRNPA